MANAVRWFTKSLVLVVVVTALSSVPERAEADVIESSQAHQQLIGSTIAFGLVAVPTMVTFGIADLIYLGRNRHMPAGWAVPQLAFAMIDFVIGSFMLDAALRLEGEGDDSPAAVQTSVGILVISGALIAAAVHQLATPYEEEPDEPESAPRAW